MFGPSKIPRRKFPLVRQNRFVDEVQQAVEVKDILFYGRSRNQELESVARDTAQGAGLSVVFTIDARQRGGLVEHGHIP